MSHHDEITVAGMRFHALVGILPHERDVPQPLEIDVVARVTGGADPRSIVDYRALYDATARVASSGHVAYLEDVAERVASGALETIGVRSVTVRVRKPHVALGGPVAYAEVAIERPRT